MKPTPRKRPSKVLRLPSATRFAALSLEERSRVFTNWVARQPREKKYEYTDTHGCILATFAKLLFRSPFATAGAHIISERSTREDILRRIQVLTSGQASFLINRTYGEASDALQAALSQ